MLAAMRVADETTASYGDPRTARIQSRKRRIEKSGLRLIPGGRAS
jgi:hypothetical protein